MYCTNCGKEINEEDKFCGFCGKKNKKVNICNKDENNKEKIFSMKYFNFFKTWYVGFLIIMNLITLIGNVEYIQNFENEYIIIFFIIDIVLYILIPIKLISDLDKKTEFIFCLLMSFLILDYGIKTISSTLYYVIDNRDSNYFMYLILYALIYGIWYIPNIIYFTKRRKMFTN